jgi:hypothetical protein
MKLNLQYPTNYSTHYKDKCYVNGIKTELSDLETTSLSEISDKIIKYLYFKGEFN